ncbi:MAG: hypothetical protein KY475_10480, partial [Planctomycetes bacterium]|nr:hypothetical protein [Planctomycetota bacterium]
MPAEPRAEWGKVVVEKLENLISSTDQLTRKFEQQNVEVENVKRNNGWLFALIVVLLGAAAGGGFFLKHSDTAVHTGLATNTAEIAHLKRQVVESTAAQTKLAEATEAINKQVEAGNTVTSSLSSEVKSLSTKVTKVEKATSTMGAEFAKLDMAITDATDEINKATEEAKKDAIGAIAAAVESRAPKVFTLVAELDQARIDADRSNERRISFVLYSEPLKGAVVVHARVEFLPQQSQEPLPDAL